MFGGLNRLLVFALVAGAFFVVPSAALACNNGVSAVNVYKECVPSGGGGTHTAGGTQTGGTTTVQISKKTALALKKAGADGKSLKDLVNSFGGPRRMLQSSSAGTEPTAVGSAFDLGAGPTALLVVLAGSALLLVGATGLRTVRQRRH